MQAVTDKPKVARSRKVQDEAPAPVEVVESQWADHRLTRQELDFLLRAVSKDGHRQILCHICLTRFTNGAVLAFSTDTHRLHVVTLRPAELEGAWHPLWRTLLRAGEFGALAKLHKAEALVLSMERDRLADVVMQTRKAPVSVPGVALVSDAKPDTYPHCHRVVPTDVGECLEPFALNARYVLDACCNDAQRVVFSGTSRHRPVVVADVMVKGAPWGLRSYAIVMPMAVPNAG